MKYVSTGRNRAARIIHAADVGLYPLCGAKTYTAWQADVGPSNCWRCNKLLAAIEGESVEKANEVGGQEGTE